MTISIRSIRKQQEEEERQRRLMATGPGGADAHGLLNEPEEKHGRGAGVLKFARFLESL